MLKKTLIIQNKLGLHARASIQLINTASRYQSEILINYHGRQVNAKSILCVMALGAVHGAEIELTINGEDEQTALDSLILLINNKFGEEN